MSNIAKGLIPLTKRLFCANILDNLKSAYGQGNGLNLGYFFARNLHEELKVPVGMINTSWGGNSISENLDYKHLMNVSRIGKVISGRTTPTDAEIWG